MVKRWMGNKNESPVLSKRGKYKGEITDIYPILGYLMDYLFLQVFFIWPAHELLASYEIWLRLLGQSEVRLKLSPWFAPFSQK
jgi:hypothetical protein